MSGELARVGPLAALSRKGVTPTKTGLVFDDPEMPFVEWEQVGRDLGRARDWTAFSLGDWLLAGEAMYGQEAYQAAEATGRTEDSLDQLVKVADRIPLSRRREDVAWSLHRLVAKLTPAEQDHWLAVAAEYRRSYREFQEHLRASGLIETRVSAKAIEAQKRVSGEAAESPQSADPAESEFDPGELVGGLCDVIRQTTASLSHRPLFWNSGQFLELAFGLGANDPLCSTRATEFSPLRQCLQKAGPASRTLFA